MACGDGLSLIEHAEVHQSIASCRLDCAQLISISSSIPDSVQLLVVAMEIAGVGSQIRFRHLRYSGKVDRQALQLDRATCIVVDVKISKSTSLMCLGCSIITA